MVVCRCDCVRSRLFDKLRDLGLAGFDEEKINSVFEQLLNGPVVLGREHFELPCDFGMEVRANEALACRAGREKFLTRSPP